MKVVFDPEAVQEAREAAAFYEDSLPGLGHAFLDAIEPPHLKLPAIRFSGGGSRAVSAAIFSPVFPMD